MIFVFIFLQIFLIVALLYWYARSRNIIAWGLCAVLLLMTGAILQESGLEFPGTVTKTINAGGDANVTSYVLAYDSVRSIHNDSFVFAWSWLSMIGGGLMLIWLFRLGWLVIRGRRR